MPFSSYIGTQICDSIARGVDFIPPAALYLGLFTSDAGLSANDLAAAQECSYGNYARVKVREGEFQSIVAAVDGQATNETPYSFPMATTPGGTPTHAALLDAAENGNVIAYGPLSMLGGSRPIEASLGFVIGDEQLRLIMG